MAPEPATRARLKLLLIGLFFALPFLLAWAAYWFHWTPGQSGNYGLRFEGLLRFGLTLRSSGGQCETQANDQREDRFSHESKPLSRYALIGNSSVSIFVSISASSFAGREFACQ